MSRSIGQASTSANARVQLASTAYNEQTSGAQRSLKSSNVADSAAGSGARTVKITYYTLAADGTITGPKTETVTLNGTTAVATVATDIALIEKMEVVSAGSSGVPAGAITLYTDNAGAGSAIASLAAGAVATRLGQHYVPSNAQCHLTDLTGYGTDTVPAELEICRLSYPGGVEQTIAVFQAGQTANTVGYQFGDAGDAVIPGPARIRLMATPSDVNAQTITAHFGYVDKRTGAY